MDHAKIQRVLSLGQNCRAKRQIRRVFGPYLSPSSIFDSQVTPPRSLLEYLKRDFAGMFDLADLTVRDGRVVNLRYETRHDHEFPEDISDDRIAAHYQNARARHDYLCAKTRAMLTDRKPTLYVFSAPLDQVDRAEIRTALAALRPGGWFAIAEGHGLLPQPDPALESWAGIDTEWDKILAEPLSMISVRAKIRGQLQRFARHAGAGKF